MASEVTTVEKVAALCRRRGFVYPSSDLYGGLGSSYDYAHYGVLLRQNIKNAWWRAMIQAREDVAALDSAIILNPQIWVASGHVGGFSDPMIDCRTCKLRFRADDLEHAQCGRRPSKHPGEDAQCDLTEAREFNLMFDTHVGAVRDSASVAYLRPETAQGIFLNYRNVLDTSRVRIPFGIAQVGKAFRNEVTPRNFIFRSREFEQMELEWFCAPEEAGEWLEFWTRRRMEWWRSVGVREENLTLRRHDADELAHYAKSGHGTYDIEYRYPFTDPGYGELEGIAHRASFDLEQHQQFSGTRMEYFDPETRQRFLPHVVEPASGLTRGLLVLLCEAYDVDESRPSPEILRFAPRLAPIKAGIFPLVAKAGMPEIAEKLYLEVRLRHTVQFDVKQAIGKRYARMDEAGTPFCFTIDGQTVEDQTVTVRDRDTGSQERIALDQVLMYLSERVT
jgi:glycyl-tRNA synthetase